NDLAGALKFVERGLVGDEGALAVLDRYGEPLPVREARRPGCRRVGHGQPHVRVDEPQARVPGERAWQQVRLAEDLEAVAYAEYRQPRLGRGYQLAHHGGEPGDRTAAQVVAVREAAGEDDRVNAAHVAVRVPEPNWLSSRVSHG